MSDDDVASDGVDIVYLPAYRGGGKRTVYHTDDNCPRLQRADGRREVDRDVVEPVLDHCDYWADDVSTNHSPDWGPLRSLKEASE